MTCPHLSRKPLLLALVLTFGIVVSAVASDQPPEILVRFKPGVTDEQARSVIQRHGGVVQSLIPVILVYQVTIPQGSTVEFMLDAMRSEDQCAYAEESQSGRAGYVPSDSQLGSQWHHESIRSFDAWELSRGGPNVKIAILDVGIETFNAEFTGARFLRGPDFTNGDENPEADHPHGIYTLGLLAANADNDFGGAGVDHRSEILVIKVLNGFNRGSVADLAAGIIEAAQEDADIISMSLIDYGNTNTLNLALEVAQSAGSILIACAGNGGIGNADISYPGASPLTISIGSVDSQERRTAISGTGAMLDFVAPGENLFTVASGSGNELTQFSGCSAATPLAAGIAGLMKAVNPQLTQADIKDIWIDTARDLIGPGSQDTLGRDDQYGYGMLDAAAAVQLAVEINVPISEKIENTAPISVLEKLELLDLSGNLINQIDLSAFSALAELSLANNLLGEIDVTRNAALVLLNLGNNNLSSIDISQNPLLELVDLSNNPVPCEFIDDLRSQRPEIQIEASCN